VSGFVFIGLFYTLNHKESICAPWSDGWFLKLSFFAQNLLLFVKNWIITLFSRKTPFFRRNRQKLHKTVIITSTPAMFWRV
jgi:hypothetical protein